MAVGKNIIRCNKWKGGAIIFPENIEAVGKNIKSEMGKGMEILRNGEEYQVAGNFIQPCLEI